MEGQRIELKRAIELGKALAESKELLRLRKAQAEFDLDKEAVRLYSQLRADSVKNQREQSPDMRQETLKDLEERVESSPILRELISAQEEFNRLMKDINGIVGFYVTGKENIELRGGNCSQCSGCKG